MIKMRRLRWLSVLMAMVMCFGMGSILSADALTGTGFLKTYTLTGDPEDDIVAVAQAQEGRTQSQMGYASAWCAYFVSDCAELAGQGDAIPANSNCGSLYKNIINAGGTVVSTAQKGDIVFYYCSSCGAYKHVAIAINSTTVIHGNFYYNPDTPNTLYSHVQTYKLNTYTDATEKHSVSGGQITTIIVRPNYSGSTISYANVAAGTYYFKNKSTGTYLSVDGAKAGNGQNLSVAAQQTTNAFQFKITGGTEHYFYSMLNTGYVVNPYSDTPASGTNVTLYQKDSSGTQIWKFEAVTGGYLIHLKYNPSCVLSVSGTNVQLTTSTGASSQIWTLEDVNAVPVTLSSIAVDQDTVSTIYEAGSRFKTAGVTLTATYSDGTTKTISSGYSVDSTALANVGVQEVIFTYEGKTAVLNVTVQDLFEGTGTQNDPFRIYTAEELKNVADMVNNTAANYCYGTSYYKQMADIDLSSYSNWTPIGRFYESAASDTYTYDAAFNGQYNGNCHSITGLQVVYERNYAGLFGKTYKDAVIENLSVSGCVTSTGVCVGGIVGEFGYGSVIRNCDFSGTVKGSSITGGIIGKVRGGGTISGCYVNAEVTATASDSYAGGLLGCDETGLNTNCVDTLCENSYFTGKLTGSVTGGISGKSVVETIKACTATFSNNYYPTSAADGAVAGAAKSGCTGLISSQMKTIAVDLGSPFVDNPYTSLNDGYPVFEWQLKLMGDINLDGTVSVLDVIALQKYLINQYPLNAEQSDNADMTQDGSVNAFDLSYLKKHLIGIV